VGVPRNPLTQLIAMASRKAVLYEPVGGALMLVIFHYVIVNGELLRETHAPSRALLGIATCTIQPRNQKTSRRLSANGTMCRPTSYPSSALHYSGTCLAQASHVSYCTVQYRFFPPHDRRQDPMSWAISCRSTIPLPLPQNNLAVKTCRRFACCRQLITQIRRMTPCIQSCIPLQVAQYPIASKARSGHTTARNK